MSKYLLVFPKASSALAGFLEEETAAVSDGKLIENAWRGAEAFHFYLLAQRQLQEGYVDLAMKTALGLRDYEDVLDPADIYSFLALTSTANRAFRICSNAFIKLETRETLTPDHRQQYEELALEIFTKHSSKDSRNTSIECTSCSASIPDWAIICLNCDTNFPTCIVSGRPLMEYHFWMCSACKHRAYESEIAQRQTCPHCHTSV
ncbi:WD repeat-containing protein 35-like [Mya arenaria]|uniref:WD repeat-containing protein 35-like n=1 Tax=Mya arenaria TaxID=6604 RepID=UPI0022E61506|nr:WD repeat-containing protein 35-like [Mya arenaria]